MLMLGTHSLFTMNLTFGTNAKGTYLNNKEIYALYGLLSLEKLIPKTKKRKESPCQEEQVPKKQRQLRAPSLQQIILFKKILNKNSNLTQQLNPNGDK